MTKVWPSIKDYFWIARAHHQVQSNHRRAERTSQEKSKWSHWHDQGLELKEQRRIRRDKHTGHNCNNLRHQESLTKEEFNQSNANKMWSFEYCYQMISYKV